MNQKIKAFRFRRYKRLLSRLDADEDGGRWVTTEENHKIHLNKNGVPDKGNPYVVATMTGKKPRVGISKYTKQLQSCFGKDGSTREAAKVLDGMPNGSVVVVKRGGDEWHSDRTETYIKDEYSGDFCLDGDRRYSFDGKQFAYLIENKYGDGPCDFDAFDPAEENSSQSSKPSFLEGHKAFGDKAGGSGWEKGYEYRGSGEKTVEYFKKNSNANELIDDMDYDQQEAFTAWTEGHFMRGQQHKGWDNMSITDQEYTKSMDDVLDKATLKKGIVVTRLTNAALLLGKENKIPMLSELRAMEGKKIVSRGAMSCAAAGEGLAIGARNKKVELKIAVPGGSTGAGMWVGDSRINGWGPKQREFVMNRDSQYQVGKTTYDPKRDVYTVELKWLQTLPHDYGKDNI